jgi:hypothetical protein
MWFDEHGRGFYLKQPLKSVTTLDPTGGVPEPVLIYLLPIVPTAGDIVLTEPQSSDWSDVLRFTSVSGLGSVLIYYSNEKNSMPQLMQNNVTLKEGINDVTGYNPWINQPGFYAPSPGPLEFFGDRIAPTAPEAGMTITQLGIGLAGLVFIATTKEKRRRSGRTPKPGGPLKSPN